VVASVRDDWPLVPTFTGKRVNPLALRPEDIDILDIAHHLSQICRYTGATTEFYSVAQHSVMVARECRGVLRLPALLHDAPEAYICDMAHPVKYASDLLHPIHSELGKRYRALEEEIAAVVAEAFGYATEMAADALIKIADDLIFDVEWACLIEGKAQVFQCWSPEMSESRFLDFYASECATLIP
jgi:hypothetical protein